MQAIVRKELADQTRPTVPASLNVQVVSSSALFVSWSPSTDTLPGVVVFYRVRLNGQIHSVVTAGLTSKDVTGLEPDTNYTISVAAVDDSFNESEQAIAAPVKTNGTVTNAMKFNPGIWIALRAPFAGSDPGARIDNPTVRQTYLDAIDSIGTDGFTGVSIAVCMRSLDARTTSPATPTTVTPADYTAGIGYLKIIYDKCVSYGLRLMLTVNDSTSGNSAHGPLDYEPDYIVNDTTNYGTAFYNGGGGYSRKTWQQNTADRTIALASVLCPIVNAWPKFEALCLMGETARNINTGGYSGVGLRTQWNRIMAAGRAAMPNTMLFQFMNDFDPYNDVAGRGWLADCVTHKVMYTNPNTVKLDITLSDRLFCGMNDTGQGSVITGYTDYRNVLPSMAFDDDNDFWSNYHGPPAGVPFQSMQEIWNCQTIGYNPTNQTGPPWSGTFLPARNPSHFAQVMNTYGGNATNQWPGAQKTFLKSKIPSGQRPSYPVPSVLGTVITGG